MTDTLLLKWGTLKDWSRVTTPAAKAALERYFSARAGFSAMSTRDTPAQQQAVCDVICAVAQAGGVILNDWDGSTYTKEQALDYVRNYGLSPPLPSPPAPSAHASPDAEQHAAAGLRRLVSPAGVTCVGSRPWRSVTFAGVVVTLQVVSHRSVASLISDHDFALPGWLTADASVTGVLGNVHTVEMLLIKDSL